MVEEKKAERFEREYVIPLRDKWKRVPRYKRANKAIKAIKEFLAKHMKTENRDLKLVKLDKFINEQVWFRGIKKPPARIKVKVIKESNGEVRAELVDYPEKLKFKKAREEKRISQAKETAESKKEAKSLTEQKEEKTEEEKTEEKIEEIEKKSAVVESGRDMGKQIAKQSKHQTKEKVKQPKRQQRKALAK